MPVRDVDLAIVTPMANEAATVERFVTEVLAVCERFPFARLRWFVILDRVSTDTTGEQLQDIAAGELRLKVVWAPENRSVVDAYLRGYREALAWGADWLLELDAGFSHDPRSIPAFFKALADGHDCAFGVRFGLEGARFDGSLKRRIVSQGGTWLANRMLGTKMTDMTSGFEIFTADALRAILDAGIESRGPFFQTEIRTHAHELNWTQVPIHYRSPSHAIGRSALADAFAGLKRLRARRRTLRR
ncbi:MAG: glycosyltransferase family 2 protein [Chromatiales bacterium]|nr:glycosyltransferase family 2 protein [Chromatiales bacterium]